MRKPKLTPPATRLLALLRALPRQPHWLIDLADGAHQSLATLDASLRELSNAGFIHFEMFTTERVRVALTERIDPHR